VIALPQQTAMNPAGQLPRNSTNWLLDSQPAPYADSFKHHLTERRYASSSTKMRRYQPPDDLRKFLQAL
jgi:hypothetical protein